MSGEGAVAGRATLRHGYFALAVICAAAAAIRIGYALTLAPPLGVSDDTFYSEAGRLIAAGHGYIDPFAYLFHHRQLIAVQIATDSLQIGVGALQQLFRHLLLMSHLGFIHAH